MKDREDLISNFIVATVTIIARVARVATTTKRNISRNTKQITVTC